MKIEMRRAKRSLGAGLASALALAVMTTGVQMGNAAQAAVQDPATPLVPAGLSSDAEAITEAAQEYSNGDATAAAALAGAASATEAVDLDRSGGAVAAETVDGGEVSVTRQGEVELTTPGLPSVGIGVEGDASDVTFVDGAVVQTEVTPSTDVVTRATENGVQIVGVFGDADASGELTVPVDLPAGTTLVPAEDGSLRVMAEVVTEVPAPGEEERINAELDALLGDLSEVDGDVTLSDEQLAALAAIDEPETVEIVETRQIATVDAPWAVDANGAPVATHFEVDGGVIKQVVDIDETTAFPVAADPSWWWWTKKAGGCIASVGGLIVGGAAIATAGAKIYKALKNAKAGSKLRSAYNVWLQFGGNNRDRAVNFLLSFRTFGGLVLKHGAKEGLKRFKASKKVAGAAAGAAVIQFVYDASGLLTNVLGIDACISLATGKD